MRKAVSRRRCSSVANSKSSDSKISRVRQEGDRRAGLARVGSPLLELALRDAARVGLAPDVAVAADLDVQLLRQRVDDGEADAVQAAGDLVAAAVAELAAGVQDGQHDLGGRLLLLLHDRDGDAAAVVDDGDGVVRVDRDRDGVVAAGERLVDGVVDDLVDQVVQAAHTGRADVHAGTLADRLEALEDGDVLGVVARALLSLLPLVPSLPAMCLRRSQDDAPATETASARGRGEAFTCT